MLVIRQITKLFVLLTIDIAAIAMSQSALAQASKPNILFIMGDDIGWMQRGSITRADGRGNTQHRPHRQ